MNRFGYIIEKIKSVGNRRDGYCQGNCTFIAQTIAFLLQILLVIRSSAEKYVTLSFNNVAYSV